LRKPIARIDRRVRGGRTLHGRHPVQIENTGMVMYRIVDGKIAETWVELDRLRAMQQMGAVPAPAGTTA
jgi:hypothetical protein